MKKILTLDRLYPTNSLQSLIWFTLYHWDSLKYPPSIVVITVLSTLVAGLSLHSTCGKLNLNTRFSLKLFLNSVFVSPCYFKKSTQAGLEQHKFIIWEFYRSEVSLGYNQGFSRAAFLLEALRENPFPCLSISERLSESLGSCPFLPHS